MPSATSLAGFGDRPYVDRLAARVLSSNQSSKLPIRSQALGLAENLDEPQLVGDPGEAQFITAFNASLQWRNVHQALSTHEQKRLRQLAG